MTRACHIAVRAATGDVFSDKDIDDFLDRFQRAAERAGREDPSADAKANLETAARALTREELMAALIEKRLRVAARIARDARRERLDALPGDESQKLSAYDLGTERQGKFSGASVDAEGRSRQMTLWGKVDIGLSKFPGLKDRLSNFWGRSENGFDRLVAREMARLNGAGQIEPTGDEGALRAARVLVGALRDARKMQNDVGAWISELPGYVARQSHDRLKVAGGFWRELGEVGRRAQAGEPIDWNTARLGASKRAFRAWRDFILPQLDEATFKDLSPDDVDLDEGKVVGGLENTRLPDNPADVRERFLARVWTDIVTGRHEQLSGMDDLADFRAPAGKASAVSLGRVLHFKDPDAWLDYNARYGSGGLFSAVMEQLSRAGRNTALMERYGPNPEAARVAEVERLAASARARGDPGAAAKVAGPRQASDFEALNGRLNVPENLRLAMVFRLIRSWEAVTKLGGIVLSKVTDIPLTGQTFARAGAGFFKGYEAAFTGLMQLDGPSSRRAAELLDVGARSFAGHLGGQFNAADGALGWSAWATRLMYRINFFEAMNDSIQRSSAGMLSRFLAQEAEAGWSKLQVGTREMFDRFGVEQHHFELAARDMQTLPDGLKYFTLDGLDHSDDPNAAEASLRLRTMIHDIVANTTSETRLREQAGLAFHTRAGTILGEAGRSMSQFRGFLQTVVGRHAVPAARGYAGYKPAALLAHLIVATTLAGYLSMNAKRIVSGEAPRPLVGATPADTAHIWLASIAQGGGLGIYGDYLFGEANRDGLDFTLSSLMGPSVGDAEKVAQIVTQATHGGAISETTGKSQIPGELVRLGVRNAPLVNLWYTRLALDYLIFWRMEEAVSPGYLQRRESNIKREEHGRGFLLAPTSAAP